MFKDIFLFELKYRIKRPATYLYFLIFFILVFFAIVSNNVTIGEQAGNMLRNSPSAIFRITAIMSAFGMLITSAIMSTPVLRDFDHNTNHLLFSYPIKKFAYLAGRFLGSYIFAVFVMLSVPLAIMAGSFIAPATGLIEASKFDSFRIMSYLSPFLILVIPNVFFTGAIFFTLSSLKRRMIYSYLGSVLLLVIYVWGITQLTKLDTKAIAALLDPFGIASFSIDTEYWTPSEINTRLVPLSNTILINRVIWSAIGILLFVLTLFRFKLMSVFENKRKKTPVMPEQKEDVFIMTELPKISRVISKRNRFFDMLKQGLLEFKTTIKEMPFIGITVAGVLLLLSNAVSIGEMYGTNTYPVTYNLLEFTSGNFAMIIYIIITFYAGEIVWRERGYGINQITDALPLPNWFFAGSKLLTMFLILVLLQTVLFVVNILTQVFHGFYEFNIPLYLTELYTVQLPTYFGIAVLAMLIQTIVKNKYAGHVIVLFYYIIFYVAFGIMGVEHYLFKYPQVPASTYSDMNGFGHFLKAVRWYQCAWLCLAIILILIMVMFWNRGFQQSLSNRIKLAKAQFKGITKYAFFSALIGFVIVGGVIIYNTTILNPFINQKASEKMMAEYEKIYKKYEGIPQPKIKAVNVQVDIYPEERNVRAKGNFLLKNETKSEIDSVHIMLPFDIRLVKCEFSSQSTLVLKDTTFGYYIAKLDRPLIPGDSLNFIFSVEYLSIGFVNGRSNTKIVRNGTFLNNVELLPVIGYQSGNELPDKDKRKKYNLSEKERMAPRTDSAALMYTYLGDIGDWITFEATVSTIPDQIAIAPGHLIEDKTVNGRRYFRYKTDRPILNFYSFVSAEYELVKDQYKDVTLEVYYHKGHEYNVKKMIEAMKESLDYFTKNFSPYQFKELRILEFPRYASFAQSFPTTIPYSENIGFIANIENEEDIDYVYYVTAHEIAHQWWAHQVIGGDVQGATLMSESLSQYSALMVMEKKYGKDQMKKFLKYELDRYLRGRKMEMKKELPLILCENQSYIHYNKGSVVMYALQDYIGEQNLNKVLSEYLSDWAYKAPPFSNSADFMNYIYKATPDSLRYFVTDMFEGITLYDIKTKDAVCEKLENGKYKLIITADVQKFSADSLGFETPMSLNDFIDVGVMTTKTENGKSKEVALYLEKHRINTQYPTFEIILDEKPESAGVDPYNKLIDRHSDNNTVKVKMNP